ncbi:MAG: AAA family ATPase [Sphaerochaeta sp.]
MLSRFTVGNFLSFNKPQSFSMLAGPVQKHSERLYQAKDFKVLKFSAIYGANAAGKTNLVRALSFAKGVVLRNPSIEDDDYFFKLNPQNKTHPSYFDFEIIIDESVYSYGFEINLERGAITEEWLIQLNADRDVIIFSRNTITGHYEFNKELLNPDSIPHFDLYMSDMAKVKDTLFIKNIVTNKDPLYEQNPQLSILQRVYRWFQVLDISFPSLSVSGFSCFFSTSVDEILKTLKVFATGISNIHVFEISKEQLLNKLPDREKKRLERDLMDLEQRASDRDVRGTAQFTSDGILYLGEVFNRQWTFKEVAFEHNGFPGIYFSLKEESAGTQRLLDLLTILLASEEGSVFVIDELDRSLHPQLTVHFVKNFLRLAKQKNIQLIITTHESHLLDLTVLRQDEIWFVEKDTQGASTLIPFDRFKERFDKKIERAYLDGRYGGVPILDEFFISDDGE